MRPFGLFSFLLREVGSEGHFPDKTSLWTFLRCQTCPKTEMRPRRRQSWRALRVPWPVTWTWPLLLHHLPWQALKTWMEFCLFPHLRRSLTRISYIVLGVSSRTPPCPSTACHCGTFFRPGDAVVGLAQALADLRGTPSSPPIPPGSYIPLCNMDPNEPRQLSPS